MAHNNVESIPLPHDAVSTDVASDAWRNAQEALKRIQKPFPPENTSKEMEVLAFGNANAVANSAYMTTLQVPGQIYTPFLPQQRITYPLPPAVHGGYAPVRFSFNSRPQFMRSNNAFSNIASSSLNDGSVQPPQRFTPVRTVFSTEQRMNRPPLLPSSAPPAIIEQKSLREPARKDFCGLTLPLKLQEYWQRAYTKCTSDDEKNRVDVRLKDKILPLLESRTYTLIDWDKEPLPNDEAFLTGGANSWVPSSVLKRGRGRGTTRGRNVFSTRTGSSGVTTSPDRASRVTGGRYVARSRSPCHSRSSHSHSPPSRRFRRRSDGSRSPKERLKSAVAAHQKSVHIVSDDDRKIEEDITNSKVAKALRRKNKKMFQKQKKKAAQSALAKRQLEPGEFLPLSSTFVMNDDSPEQRVLLNKRAERFAGHMSSRTSSSKVLSSRLKKRLGHLQIDSGASSPEHGGLEDSVKDLLSDVVVGTSEDIEKQYLRLTSVRPEHVLVRSLDSVKARWAATKDYHYACEQLKSIRQDLTIQCIRNSFTIEVYETHARIALEKGDREEFNQCQSQLKALYRELTGSPHELEFTAYRLLYYIFTQNTIDMVTFSAQLSDEAKANPCVLFAVNLQAAWTVANYHRFFRLYRGAPKMSGYLIAMFVERERKQALRAVLKAYRPCVPVDFIVSELAFADRATCLTFLQELHVPVENDSIDCRQCANLTF